MPLLLIIFRLACFSVSQYLKFRWHYLINILVYCGLAGKEQQFSHRTLLTYVIIAYADETKVG